MGMQVLKMLAYPLAYHIVCCSAERQASYFVHLFVCFYFLSGFFFPGGRKLEDNRTDVMTTTDERTKSEGTTQA